MEVMSLAVSTSQVLVASGDVVALGASREGRMTFALFFYYKFTNEQKPKKKGK